MDTEQHIVDLIVDNNKADYLEYDYDDYRNTILEPHEEKDIYIKEIYRQTSTKKDNKGLFLTSLKRNVDNSLKNEDVKVTFDGGRMFVTPNEDNFDIITNKLNKVFGIHEIDIVYKLDNDYELYTVVYLIKRQLVSN